MFSSHRAPLGATLSRSRLYGRIMTWLTAWFGWLPATLPWTHRRLVADFCERFPNAPIQPVLRRVRHVARTAAEPAQRVFSFTDTEGRRLEVVDYGAPLRWQIAFAPFRADRAMLYAWQEMSGLSYMSKRGKVWFAPDTPVTLGYVPLPAPPVRGTAKVEAAKVEVVPAVASALVGLLAYGNAESSSVGGERERNVAILARILSRAMGCLRLPTRADVEAKLEPYRVAMADQLGFAPHQVDLCLRLRAHGIHPEDVYDAAMAMR